MSATMTGQRGNILKPHWLKCPKIDTQKKKTNYLKPHVWSLFFNFRFSGRNYQSQQKLAKNITYFTIQFHSKSLTHFINLNSLNIAKNILPQHSKNLLTLQIFHQKCFWLVSKFALHHF